MYKIRQIILQNNNKILLITAAVAIIMAASAALFFMKENSETILIRESGTEDSTKTEQNTDNDNADSDNNSQLVYVDVEGCVRKPGVYQLSYSARVFEAIEQAGGFTSDADPSSINQAEAVVDGMKITVPDKNDKDAAEQGAQYPTGSGSSDGTVNINTADSDTLQQIPGIGPVTAQKIIEYRESNGSFKTTEDIKNVSGIGDKTYEKMRPHITI